MITYFPLTTYVYAIDYLLPYNLATIKQELLTVNWRPWNISEVHKNENVAYRYEFCEYKENAILRDVANYFNDPNGYARDLIDRLYQDTDLGQWWAFSKEELFDRSFPHVNFYKDAPGLELQIHLDNRRLVSSGMIVFTEHDDPDVSTYFYSNEKGDNPIRATTGVGKGWTAATTHNTWHKGQNSGNDFRYSMYFGLVINIQPNPK